MARFYDPALGRFLSADALVPDPNNPQDLNRYAYVRNNPLKYIDPTGYQMEGYDPGANLTWRWWEEPLPDGRDLTQWIVAEANADATSKEVALIRWNNLLPFNMGKPYAWAKWISLVQDSARWDFKDEIEERLQGGPTRLGDEWFEYSTAGNILYGFTGAAAGFDVGELHLGATVAQILDALKSDNPKDDVGPVLPSFLDQVDDYYAVDFGWRLYRKCGAGVTEAEFRAFLVDYRHADKLAKMAPPPNFFSPPDDWPYGPGTFDNPAGRR